MNRPSSIALAILLFPVYFVAIEILIGIMLGLVLLATGSSIETGLELMASSDH